MKSAEAIFQQSGVEKRRVGSCEECRASKHRCSRTKPSCRRCVNKGLKCNYPDKADRHDGQRGSVVSSEHEASPSSQQYTNSQPHLLQQPSFDTTPGFGVDYSRLYSDTLPDDASVRRRLVESFFDRSHPLRCLSFLHRSTFMQSLDRDSVVQDYGQPLLYAMCALGARHIYFDNASTEGPDHGVPGQRWAERARQEVLADIHSPSVNDLMAMTLLCDYGVRADQNSMVFVLVSFLYRVIRLHGLDNPEPLEDPHDYAALMQRDTENRLVWACYFIDFFTATGVVKNSCWNNFTPNIPLPVVDRTFAHETSSIRHFLLTTESNGIVPALPDLDLPALSVLVIRLRMTGLRLIRTRPQELITPIWDPSSEFLQTIQTLDSIYHNLPERYHLTESNIPILQEQQILGGVFLLHYLLHAIVSDLTRPSLPGFNFPLAGAFEAATPDFRTYCQNRCRHHAVQTTGLIRQGLSYGRTPFDDIYSADAALEAAKIQIIYAATVNQSPDIIQETRENISLLMYFFNLFNRGKRGSSQYVSAMLALHSSAAVPNPLKVQTLMPLCFLFGFRDIAEPWRRKDDVEGDAEVTGSADIEHLSRFAPFRRARSALKAQSTNSPRTSSSRSRNNQPSPAVDFRSQQPMSQGVPTPTFPVENQQAPPTLRPEYSNFPPQQNLPMDAMNQAFFQTAPESTIPQVASLQVPEMMPLQPSMDDYIRTADDMAGYLTWDVMEVPSWLNYGNLFPPAG